MALNVAWDFWHLGITSAVNESSSVAQKYVRNNLYCVYL